MRDGWKCGSLAIGSCRSASTPPVLDFLLAFGDAQGNFLAVKVSGTNLPCLHLLKFVLSAGKKGICLYRPFVVYVARRVRCLSMDHEALLTSFVDGLSQCACLLAGYI